MNLMNIFTKNRILTGIRPTGALHLGHYVGALHQWLDLQSKYECFFLIADIQALSTHADNPVLIKGSVREVVLDWLAIGLNPKLSNVHFVLQSAVPELTELTEYLSMVTPKGLIDRNPTIQAESQHLKGEMSVGFYTYPVSQAADILGFSFDPRETSAKILVPVGEDQVPHLRSTNETAKRFNKLYGNTLSYCEPLVGEVGRLPGINGSEKMSKSLNNAIYLGEPVESLRKKVMSMFTDPKRIRPDIPGDTVNNPVFIYHRAFNPNKAEVQDLTDRYQRGKVSDVEVKEKLFKALNHFLTPIRVRRMEAEHSDLTRTVREGTAYARSIVKKTLVRTRKAMHIGSAKI